MDLEGWILLAGAAGVLLLAGGVWLARRMRQDAARLFAALEEGDRPRVAALLARGVPVRVRDAAGNSLLHRAVAGTLGRRARPEVVELLLDRGAEVNARDGQGATPLHWACRGGYADIVVMLLDRRAELNARDAHQDTPLYWARKAGHQDIVALLEKRGAVE